MMQSYRKKITRNRDLRSCTECYKRKLKCDRQSPCSSCSKRNEEGSCVYEKSLQNPRKEHERLVQAEARLEHLEQLVKQLSGREDASSLDSGTDRIQYDEGAAANAATSTSANGSFYKGSTHWSAMLEDVEELRYAILHDGDIDVEDDDAHTESGFAIVFGAARYLSFQQILQKYLPSRREADRLVSTYFRATAVAAPSLHAPSFYRAYQAFWTSFSIVSPLWTSILFSVLHTADVALSPRKDDGPPSSSRFAVAAAHCLAVGQYYRPQCFAVEALLLFAHSHCLTSTDMHPELAIVFATLIRIATCMGYHREPAILYPNFSPFEAEMRRRTWSHCMQLDLLVSFQLGLPPNVQWPTWDTRPPTNLLASDFDENTVILPPARPDSEFAEILLYITKHIVISVFEKIIRHTSSVAFSQTSTDDSLEDIDRELREVYASIPAIFQPRRMEDSVMDSPTVIVSRLCVYSIYEKCLCVLHRKYVVAGRLESIRICYDASTALVRRFVELYDEFLPGGQLATERWFMGSLTWNDFLLGCNVLCLVIFSVTRHRVNPGSAAFVDVEASLNLLQAATARLEQDSTSCKDAKRVARITTATARMSAESQSREMWAIQDSGSAKRNGVNIGNGQPQGNNGDASLWADTVTGDVGDVTWDYLEGLLNLSDANFAADMPSWSEANGDGP